jgi:hypothetical protein
MLVLTLVYMADLPANRVILRVSLFLLHSQVMMLFYSWHMHLTENQDAVDDLTQAHAGIKLVNFKPFNPVKKITYLGICMGTGMGHA